MNPPQRIPLASYRLQLRREFPFSAARAVIPYLKDLGVSDLYLSPISFARPGSAHGYDILDHERLNPELGSQDDLVALMDAAHGAGMGVIFDVVPNHMCILGETNQRWQKVLEDGQAAATAADFDIDWDPPKPELAAKILLPFLDEQYGRVLESELSIAFRDGEFTVSWSGGRLPLAPETSLHIVSPALEILRGRVSPDDPCLLELESVVRALTHTLPALRRRESAAEREREKEAVRRRLADLATTPAVRAAIDDAVAKINGVRGVPSSFDALERLMNEQVYRLAHWRVAAHEINYRRFFDINELAAVRVESAEVFAAVHALVLSVANHPAFTGIRVDHLDGLADPAAYLQDLARAWRVATGKSAEDPVRPYVVVEKILASGETLRPDFVADGTTGYDFIDIAAGTFLLPEGASKLRALSVELGGPLLSFSEVAAQCKRLMLENTLAAELTVLARQLDRLSEQHRYTRDFTLNQLHAALAEVVAGFGVYRTYVRELDTDETVAEPDVHAIKRAVATARRRNRLLNASLFHFIESVLLHRDPPGLQPEQLQARRMFVTRFQQLTSPVYAKGIEDTAFYRYLALIALNEVGGNPGHWRTSDSELHGALAARLRSSPNTLSASATHDTKRGEDARARLYVLSEVAEAFSLAARRWFEMNYRFKGTVDDAPVPDSTEEYLLYQTLVGAWPLAGWSSEPDFGKRIIAYMVKARHEAKQFTSYINPNLAYEVAAEGFVANVLDPSNNRAFLQDVEQFLSTIATAGLCNSLSQLVLKLTAPGVPDFFQGRENWDFSLVDPDNRRLVDYSGRHKLLRELSEEFATRGARAVESWFDKPNDGRIKVWVTSTGLALRKRKARLFQCGDCLPLKAQGPRASHIFAFARTDANDAVVTVLGRHFTSLQPLPPKASTWRQTVLELPESPGFRELHDAITGQSIRVDGGHLALEQALRWLPFALLETRT
jgi:(1->4)-alpha-D-glucan 1-alpha-D-glucosylmutase